MRGQPNRYTVWANHEQSGDVANLTVLNGFPTVTRSILYFHMLKEWNLSYYSPGIIIKACHQNASERSPVRDLGSVFSVNKTSSPFGKPAFMVGSVRMVLKLFGFPLPILAPAPWLLYCVPGDNKCAQGCPWLSMSLDAPPPESFSSLPTPSQADLQPAAASPVSSMSIPGCECYLT